MVDFPASYVSFREGTFDTYGFLWHYGRTVIFPNIF